MGLPDIHINATASFPGEPPIISESQRAMEAVVQKERQRVKDMEKEEENLTAEELRTVLKRERHRMARMAADLASMRAMAVKSVADAEACEEGRINNLMRRLECLQQEKGRIIVELEREEEMVCLRFIRSIFCNNGCWPTKISHYFIFIFSNLSFRCILLAANQQFAKEVERSSQREGIAGKATNVTHRARSQTCGTYEGRWRGCGHVGGAGRKGRNGARRKLNQRFFHMSKPNTLHHALKVSSKTPHHGLSSIASRKSAILACAQYYSIKKQYTNVHQELSV